MSLPTMPVTVNLYDGTGAPLTAGSAVFTPTGDVTVNSGLQEITPAPVTVQMTGGLPSAALIPTDIAGSSPSGWGWQVAFPAVPGAPPAFTFKCPAGPVAFTAAAGTPGVVTWTASSAVTAIPNGCGVQFTGTAPAGTVTGTTYYVTGASGQTLNLAATVGGSAIAFTGSGSGTLAIVSYLLSGLVPLGSSLSLSQFMFAPSGTPSSGQVPIATGTGTASAWGTVSGGAGLASPAFTGTPTAPTASPLTNSTQVATTAYADAATLVEKTRALAAEALLAPLASAALTGSPTAPTATTGDNTTKIATSAFVTTAVAAETTRATTAEAVKAPLASPALTGVPTAPTASAGTSTTQVATTAFTAAAVTAGVPAYGTTSGTVAQGNDSRIVEAALANAAASTTASGSTATLNLANGLTQAVTLAANCTFSFSGWPAGASTATVIITENGTGGYSPQFSGVTWVGGQPAQATAAGAVSVYSFLSPNGGTTVYGAGVSNSFTGPGSGDIFDWYTSAGSKVVWIDSTGRAHFGAPGLAVGSNVLAGTSVYGSQGNPVLNFVDVMSAINFVDVLSSASGTGPSMNANSGGTTPDPNVDLFLNPKGSGSIGLNGATTTTAPAAGAAGALPATPTGYLTVKVGGTLRKIAYY